MRHLIWLGLLAAGVLAVAPGCAIDPQQRAFEDPLQRQLAKARTYHDYFDEAAANAIVRQAAVFDHHFEPRTARLNDLGRHELRILARAFREDPCDVKMPRGTVSDALYDARARAVIGFLNEQQVDTAAVRVIDAQPDGDGMASGRVADALAAEAIQPGRDRSESFVVPVTR